MAHKEGQQGYVGDGLLGLACPPVRDEVCYLQLDAQSGGLPHALGTATDQLPTVPALSLLEPTFWNLIYMP